MALVEGRTEKQREVNRLKLVKDQQIRQELSQCSSRVKFSENKRKTSDKVRNELITIMEAEMELSVGRRFRHLCEKDNEQKWYRGMITKVDKHVTVKYDD